VKKIINGLTYNTETAERLCDTSNDLNGSDFGRDDSALYRTRNGRFFLLGNGGANSRWSISTGQNSWRGTTADDIHAIEDYEARALVEAHGSAALYERIFGEAEEA
jgi:hypothetical protein